MKLNKINIMQKSILNLSSIKKLSNLEQKQIKGGVKEDWFRCCLRENSPELPPLGCESWVICDGF